MTDTTYITDEQEQDAIRVLRESYMASVRGIADDAAAYDAAEAVLDPDNYDAAREDYDAAVREDALRDYIEGSVDGSEWIVYTWRARLVRSLSNHDDAYIDDGGDGFVPIDRDIDTVITAWAYHSMIADVRGVLNDRAFLAERAAATK